VGFKGGEGFASAPTGKIITELLPIPIPVLGEVETAVWSGGLLEAFALTVPIPTVSDVVVEDHSGGAFTATPALAIPIPTSVAVAELV